jgi:predicted nucleic acid-binding protein
MILVDTSVWVDHFRAGNRGLVRLLDADDVVNHPWITGELALGHLGNRREIIGLLRALPQAVVADDAEVLRLIESEPLHGSGIGYVDAQLLASTRLTPDARLWTNDKRLRTVAARGLLAFQPAPDRNPRAAQAVAISSPR